MGLARSLRRMVRRSEPQIAPSLSVLTEQAAELADNLFDEMILSGDEMPSRSSVESDVKTIFMRTLDRAIQSAVESGTAPAEVKACIDMLTSHVQITFQERWVVLERRHAMLASADVARAH